MPAPSKRRALVPAFVLVLAFSAALPAGQEQFRFKTGVELINISATVTDTAGRFVAGLTQADFQVFDDDTAVEITHFSAERVPVSLGILIDSSASMRGEKIAAARAALERFMRDLLGPDDEIFLYRFANRPQLVVGWTMDRVRIAEELKKIEPDGATALYDAVVEALPLLESGRHRKKALLVISDGNDTSSRTDLVTLKDTIRQSEALVYAIGLDAQKPAATGNKDRARSGGARFQSRPPRMPFPRPRPLPPSNPPGVPTGPRMPRAPAPDDSTTPIPAPGSDPVNLPALRDITDNSGGRTEILRSAVDLGPATERIADELSKQYSLGYRSPDHRDGRWHAIRVETRDRTLRVRARRGYVATR